MFGKKVQVQEKTEASTLTKFTLGVAELIRKHKIDLAAPEKPENYEHLKKMWAVTGIGSPEFSEYFTKENRYSEYETWREPFLRAGFSVFVYSSIIKDLKYHAEVGDNRFDVRGFRSKGKEYYNGITTEAHDQSYDKIIFSGDLPDFALDTIAAYKRLFQLPDRWCEPVFITIHSNESLPIRREEFKLQKYVDPIVIAWKIADNITVSATGELKSGFHGINRGIVLACWGADGNPLEI